MGLDFSLNELPLEGVTSTWRGPRSAYRHSQTRKLVLVPNVKNTALLLHVSNARMEVGGNRSMGPGV